MSEMGEPMVICLTSHNRIDCARINQEIIKLNYRTPFKVVHACSGAQKERYLEDEFIRCAPKPMNAGAIHLLQQSIRVAVERFAPSYIVHLEADAWVLDEEILLGFIRKMDQDRSLLLAASAWSEPGVFDSVRNSIRALTQKIGSRNPAGREPVPQGGARSIRDFSTQFFIIRNHPPLVDRILDMMPDDGRSAERQFFEAFTGKFGLNRVLRMIEREPVHPHNRYMCERLALYCQHWPAAGTANDPRASTHPLYVSPAMMGKKEVLAKYPTVRKGESINRLLAANDFDYYNPGAGRY